jgi:hypothetical protein
MHVGRFEKTEVWPNGDRPATGGQRSPGKVTDEPDLAICPGRNIIVRQENYRSFLDIYNLVRAYRRFGGE